jgi:hypothetical protein
MSDQNRIFNEIDDLFSWMNETNFIQPKAKNNIRIIDDDYQIDPVKPTESNQQINTKINPSQESTKSKKLKCSLCKVKISLVDDLISTCKCEKKYCSKHRMPETHNCVKLEEIGKEQRKTLESTLVKLDSKFSQIKL